jgi:beta-glucanase (GH16 family)
MKFILSITLALAMSASTEFAQTAPSQAAGYELVFSDNFSNFDLSPNGYGTHTWYPGIYFQPGQAGPVTVNQSTLDLQWDIGGGENSTNIEGCAYDASHCTTFRYGYFEARMRWDVTNGAWPAFWMITKQSILGVQDVGELDIFEGQGNAPADYYGTINEWKNGALFSTNYSGFAGISAPGLTNQFPLAKTNDFSQWHTYGVLWAPGSVTWYYDNDPVGTAPTPAIFDQEDFFFILGSQEGYQWTPGNLTNVTAQAINLNVQWVHAFQLPSPAATNATTRQTPISPIVPEIVSSGQAPSEGPLQDSQILKLTLDLPLQNQPELDSLLQQLANPQSPTYLQYLSPDEFTARFGPTQEDYTAVVNWAQSNGLTVTETTSNRLSMGVAGSVGTINQAFQITLNSYKDLVGNRVFFAPDHEPTLDLSVRLLGITGLTSFRSLEIRAMNARKREAFYRSRLTR